MPPMEPNLPPRLAERIARLDWPETVEDAERSVFAEVSIAERGDLPATRYRSFPEAVADWPLGAEIVDAILETVGPSAAAIMRRRVVLIGGDGAKIPVDVKRVPAPQNELAGADLIFSVDARNALALLAPPPAEAALSAPEARLHLVRLIDRACSIIDDGGRVRRTVPNEPSWHVARWGGALTPHASALIEYGRTLPRAQMTFGDEVES